MWDIDNDSAEPGLYVKEIEFNDGSKVQGIKRDDIIVLVGANNVGKSQTLKDIYSGLGDESTSILRGIHTCKTGQVQKIINLVRQIGTRFEYSSQYNVMGKYIYLDNMEYLMNDDCTDHRNLRDLFVCNLDTEKRLSACHPAPLIARKDPKTHPIHYIAFDSCLRKVFSNYFKRAFNKCIVPNIQQGNSIPLVVTNGKIHIADDKFKDETERVEAYAAELDKYPLAQEEGDGVKGFIGILLYMVLDFYKVYLIDEPEAFLHPPQARIIGQMIGKLISRNKQAFISTHSEKLIQGLLETASDRVKIVRITRKEDINHASVLNAADIAKVWQDPILRYSNILEGLFYPNVVLCESDSDCRFYSIINDFLQEKSEKYANTFFTYSGGKHRIPVIMKALSSLGVDTKVIVDFDVLDNKRTFEKICKACGINWDMIKMEYQCFYDEINRQIGMNMNPKEDILAEIGKIAKRNHGDRYYSESEIREIKGLLKGSSYWNILKSTGIDAIPKGNAFQNFEKINKVTKSHNLFIVPVGELECFVKHISTHGPDWVNEVLDKYSDLNDDVYEKVRDFIKQLEL